MDRLFSQLRRYSRSFLRGVATLALLIGLAIDLRLRPAHSDAEGAARIHRWCQRIVAAMGVSLRVTGSLPRSGAVVSNHLSYLDILLYSAIQPTIMVAKREVRSWPLIGWLTAQAGTVYVERGGAPETYPIVNQAMADAYRTGYPVLFFPEGTTTDGSEVLPFRRGLFHSVLNNQVPLRTATLRFTIGEGNNAGATVANDVCWWGDAYLGPHLLRCLGLNGLRAAVHFEDRPIEGTDRFALSENARATVESLYASLASEAHPRTDAACEAELAQAL